MKRLIATFAVVLSLAMPAKVSADEGMWLPSLIGSRITDMQAKGFKLTAEDIYSVNEASLKDAIVLFGRGCTGEVISQEGLLLTNYHCGYSQIQHHSSVDHDYLTDGFWAMTRSEELPNDGLTVSFLERMDDVTAQVLKGHDPQMTEAQRDSLVKANSAALVREAEAEGPGLKASVEALYYGNQYFLFIYKVYEDIRLVGAPPTSIGKFGGDTDNWMWPRHTGDFSIFRIYAGPDNEPAPYSEDNVPYRPKKYFTLSLGGVKEGDFTLVYGFPGSTEEYIMSEGVRYVAEISDPDKIAIRTKRLDIQRKYMEADPAVRIKYASKNATVANAWKKWQGESLGIGRLGTVQAKRDYERSFTEWAASAGNGEYRGLIGRLDSLYRELGPYRHANEITRETAGAVEIATFASSVSKLLRKSDSPEDAEFADNLKKLAESFYKDYCLPIDRESFSAVMAEYGSLVPDSLQPDYFKTMMAEYGDTDTWADSLFSSTMFADSSKVLALTPADSAKVLDDPAYVFIRNFSQWNSRKIMPKATALQREITLLNRTYMRAQMEFEPDRDFYPDANLTLRVAYGHVGGYSPRDGIQYRPYSTLDGIIEKDNPDIYDYNIPQKLRDLYAAGDYGPWTVDSQVPVCFLATNHTSGGNSGSPVINAEGQLVGINFDRVWEGTMSDLAFDPDYCRNISLDVRYILFVIDRVAGAHHLIDEMSLSKPQ